MELRSRKNSDGQFQVSEAGTIASLAEMLFDEYGLMGFSVTTYDIQIAIINDVAFYAGWQSTQQQSKGIQANIDVDYVLSVHEWSILDPVVRAHCEVIQAQRVEGTGSLGGERFGLSVSEAVQAYNLAKETMKKESFVEPPFTLDLE